MDKKHTITEARLRSIIAEEIRRENFLLREGALAGAFKTVFGALIAKIFNLNIGGDDADENKKKERIKKSDQLIMGKVSEITSTFPQNAEFLMNTARQSVKDAARKVVTKVDEKEKTPEEGEKNPKTDEKKKDDDVTEKLKSIESLSKTAANESDQALARLVTKYGKFAEDNELSEGQMTAAVMSGFLSALGGNVKA